MNASLLNIVKSIVDEQGEGILSDHRRISAFFSDLAKDEPKPQKNAFVKCLEHGFAQLLKNASEQDRPLCKQKLAQRLHDEEGLDSALCADTLELLATVLFGEQRQVKKTNKEIGSAVTNTPPIKSTRGAVKKNELLSLKIFSIIGLFYPFLLFLSVLFEFIIETRTMIDIIGLFGFPITHFSLALVKGKRYNLKAISISAIIGIILSTIASYNFFFNYLHPIHYFLIFVFYLVFSIVTLVELKRITKNQTPYTPTE
jgi:hypothetical protein